jgi:hypothetical protein
MRELLLLVGLTFCFYSASSQITKEKSFDDDLTINMLMVNLEQAGKKMCVVNSIDSVHYVYNFYNADYSVFKTIAINLSSQFAITGYNTPSLAISYVAESLFDQDSDIDLLCQLKYYDDSNEEYAQVVVFHENGSILFESDVDNSNAWIFNSLTSNSNIVSSLANTADGAKMILDVYYFVDDYYSFDVYDLPGTLPLAAQELNMVDGMAGNYIQAYPIPANDFLLMNYRLTEGQNSGEIEIFDEHGRSVQQITVDSGRGKLTLPVSRYKDGIYFYKLSTRRGIPRTGKIIIMK